MLDRVFGVPTPRSAASCSGCGCPLTSHGLLAPDCSTTRRWPAGRSPDRPFANLAHGFSAGDGGVVMSRSAFGDTRGIEYTMLPSGAATPWSAIGGSTSRRWWRGRRAGAVGDQFVRGISRSGVHVRGMVDQQGDPLCHMGGEHALRSKTGSRGRSPSWRGARQASGLPSIAVRVGRPCPPRTRRKGLKIFVVTTAGGMKYLSGPGQAHEVGEIPACSRANSAGRPSPRRFRRR